jgi:hypothetical protein
MPANCVFGILLPNRKIRPVFPSHPQSFGRTSSVTQEMEERYVERRGQRFASAGEEPIV